MELLQLKYFKKAAELQHMTQAAAELHIAQPSLTKTIRLLERELGIDLFDRKGKYVVLNEAGKIFLHYCNSALESLDSARQELNDYKTTENAIVSLSVRVPPLRVTELVARFRSQYPTVRFQVEQHQHLLGEQNTPLCDLTFYSSMVRADDENTVSLLYENVLLALPKGHPWSQRESVAVRELADEDIIASLPTKNSLRAAIMDYCRMAGFKPKIVMECDDYMTIQSFVKMGVGLAFIPEITWLEEGGRDPDLVLIDLVEPQCGRYINLQWKNTGYVSKAAVLFRNFVIDSYANM